MKKIIQAAFIGLLIGGGLSAKIGQIIGQSLNYSAFETITTATIAGSTLGLVIGVCLAANRSKVSEQNLMKLEVTKDTGRKSA